MRIEDGKSASGFQIRTFREEDAAAASEILLEAQQAAIWSAEVIRATFSSERVSGFISEVEGKPTGFILGRGVLDEGEILNLAVSGGSWRKGVGTALVRSLLNCFATRGVRRVFLEVRESNLGAIAFYRALGFRQIGKREGYYREPVEAALVLEHSTKNPQLGTE